MNELDYIEQALGIYRRGNSAFELFMVTRNSDVALVLMPPTISALASLTPPAGYERLHQDLHNALNDALSSIIAAASGRVEQIVRTGAEASESFRILEMELVRHIRRLEAN